MRAIERDIGPARILEDADSQFEVLARIVLGEEGDRTETPTAMISISKLPLVTPFDSPFDISYGTGLSWPPRWAWQRHLGRAENLHPQKRWPSILMS